MDLTEIKKAFNLKDNQLSNVSLIIDECNNYELSTEQTAYILATAYHESKFIPCEEIGKGTNKPYGKKIKYNRKPYTSPNKIYYGRGFVQLTWYELYERFGTLLEIDLLNNPELALQPKIASEILVLGMVKGLFTGVKLITFINKNSLNFYGARKIINGLDRADLVKDYANKFYNIIK